MASRAMIKDIISKEAKKARIEVFGFTENAFVALFPYYVKGEEGNISMYARGEDYHKVVKEKLKPIAEKIISLGATKVIIHCDNGGYNDRKAAYDAGLGFYGKNRMLINDKYGSYFFIGQVICDLKFEADSPLDKTCFSCGRCENACITGTLKEGYTEENCLSGISQKKGDLTKEEQDFIKKSKMCWGCDICQRVCPHNEKLESNALKDFLNDRITSLKISDLENLSEREFKKKYGKYAFAWRGGKVLKRNLEILKDE